MGVPKRAAPPLVTPGGHQCSLSPYLCRPAGHGAAAAWCLRARWVALLQPGYAGSRSGLLGAGLG